MRRLTLEMDEDRLDEGSRRKLVAVISEESQRMFNLTIKILEMARLEAGEVISIVNGPHPRNYR